jgi:hypothetical protein
MEGTAGTESKVMATNDRIRIGRWATVLVAMCFTAPALSSSGYGVGDYGVGTPQEYGVRTFQWTYGRSGEWTSQISRNVTVPYLDGSLTGIEVTNVVEVTDGALWSEAVRAEGSTVQVLAQGDFYLSSDENLSSHPALWSFGTVTDGMLLGLSPYYLIRSDRGQVLWVYYQMLLYHVQNIHVLAGDYADALTAWTIDTRYPFVNVNMFGKEADLGLTLPTALETGGHAVTGFRIRGRSVGVIGLGRINPSTGQLQDLGELRETSPVGTFTIGGSVYANPDAPATSGLADVQVTVAGPGGTFTATTGADGHWSVDNVPECTYIVTPSNSETTFVYMGGGTPDGTGFVEIAVNQANAVANQDIRFWSGACNLTANVIGGQGSVSPSQGSYHFGDTVTLTATPEVGYYVQAWTGTDNNGSASTVNTVTMTWNKTVTVEFAAAGADDPGGYVRQGYQEAATNSLSGWRQAYHYFDLARKDAAYATNRESILLHVLGRIAMLLFDTEDAYVETSLLELAQACGVSVTGDSFDGIEVNVPLDGNGAYHLPAGIDPAAIAEAINNTVLPEIDSIAAELDTITDSPGDPFQMYLEPSETGLHKRVEVDYAEVLALKGLLAGAKASLRGLANPAYDVLVDLYASPFYGSIGPVPPILSSLLAQYPDLLKVLPTSGSSADGAARLAQAKQDLIAAIDAYFSVVDYIRAETDAQDDDFLYIDPNVDEPLTVCSARLSALKESLLTDTPATYPWLTTKTYTISQGGTPIGQLFVTYSATEFEIVDGQLQLPNPTSPEQIEMWTMGEGERHNGRLSVSFEKVGAGTWLYGDFEGNLANSDDDILDGSFHRAGYDNAVGWVDTTVTNLSGLRTGTETTVAQLDLNPVFGGTTRYPNPVNPRDLLPQLDANNELVPGTFGHGLNNDATLGGILPDLTQNDWISQGYDVWGVSAENYYVLYGFGSPAEAEAGGAALLGHSDGQTAAFAGTYDYYVAAATGQVQIDSIMASDGQNTAWLSWAWNASNGGMNTTGTPDGRFDTVGRLQVLGTVTPPNRYRGGVVLYNSGGCPGLTVVTDLGGLPCELTTGVIGGHGTVSPASGTYDLAAMVTLTATPETGYYVKAWTGTDNDSSTSTINALRMTGNRTVTVEFAAAAPEDPKGYLQQGSQEVASRSLSGLRQAYYYFDLAHQDTAYEGDRAAILWHVLARIAMLFVGTETPANQTSFLELARLYGIQVTGDAFDDIEISVPLDLNGQYHIPPGVNPDTVTQTIQSSMLLEIEDILTELNMISDSPTPFETRLSPGLTGLDQEVEVDYSDVLALRGALRGFKAFLGWASAYDLFVDPGSPLFDPATWQTSSSRINDILAAYPNLLKVLPTATCPLDGSASLQQAKQDLIAALEDFFLAVNSVLQETDLQTDDLLSLENANAPDLTELLNELQQFHDSLVNGVTGTYTLFKTDAYDLYQGSTLVGKLNLVYGPGRLLANQGYLSFINTDIVPAPVWAWSFEVRNGTVSGDTAGVWGDPMGEDWGTYEGYLDGTLTADTISNLRLRYFYPVEGEVAGLTAQFTGSAPQTIQYNPNPVFGGTAQAPANPRDWLPQFGADNWPVAGTFGHGLNNDATLGGIFPGATQQNWMGSGYTVFGMDTQAMQLSLAAGRVMESSMVLPSLLSFFSADYPEVIPGPRKLGERTDGSSGTFTGNYPMYMIAVRSPVSFDAIQSLLGDSLDPTSAPLAMNLPLDAYFGLYDMSYGLDLIDCAALTGTPNGSYVRVGELGLLGTYTGIISLDNPDPERWTGLKVTTDVAGIIGDFCRVKFDPPDGYVDVWDLMFFADHWKTSVGDPNWDAIVDLAGPSFGPPDGTIDVWDLMAFADHWHKGQKP